MPPEVSLYHPIVTPRTPLLAPLSPKSRLTQTLNQKYRLRGARKMKFTTRKLIPVLVFILAIASVLRLLKITITTSSSTTPSSAISSAHQMNHSHDAKKQSQNQSVAFANSSVLTEKEMQFLLDLVSSKAPCNLLVFGLEQQYSILSSFNEGGNTIFLEDEPEKINRIETGNNTLVYKLEYSTLARDAYKLLKHARKHKDCSPLSGLLKESKCKLALKELSKKIYRLKWDVVVVDGPCGHIPDCPGRMASIYTASVLARNGHVTNVVVHDVDRMIEKWFSWEFLCDENLVSSKGKFWNFRIVGKSNATTFCST